MDVVILLIVVLIVLGIAIYAVQNLPINPPTFKPWIIALLCVVAILVILSRTNLLRAETLLL